MIKTMLAPFRGVTAALAQRKRSVVVFGLAMLALSLLAGALARFAARPVNTLAGIQSLIVILLLFASPIVAALGLTLHRDRGTAESRLTEIQCLPLGALAMPLSVFLLSGLVLLWSGLLSLLGLALTAGSESTNMATGQLLAEKQVGAIAAVLGFAWVYLTSLAAIGRQPAAFNAIWAFLPSVFLPFVSLMGYHADEFQAYALVWLASMSFYYLALPFALYAQPRHHWFTSLKLRRTRFEMVAGLFAFLGLLFFGLFSWSRAVGFIALVGGGILGLMKWGMPPRRRSDSSLMRVSYLLALIAMLPPILIGLWAEHETWRPRSLAEVIDRQVESVSPDGRSLLLVGTDRRVDNGRARRYYFLCDPGRPEEAMSLPLRNVGMFRSWSRDGRYLAIADGAVGRLVNEGTYQWVHPRNAGIDIVESLTGYAGRTLIIDTRSGETRELEGRFLAPGWLEPEELIAAKFRQSDVVLRDGRGNTLRLDGELGPFGIDHYTEDGAVITAANHRLRWLDGKSSGIEKTLVINTFIDPILSKPGPDGPRHFLQRGKPGDDPKEAERLPLITSQRLYIAKPVGSPLVPTDDKDTFSRPQSYRILYTEGGLIRFDIDADEVRTILEGPGRNIRFKPASFSGQRLYAIDILEPETGARTTRWLDTQDWSLSEPVTYPQNFSALTRLAEGILGTDARGRARILDPNGSVRPLWPEEG